ncbi:MAG: SRPBCC domain-containing protein [Rhodospirillaceae bacterium]|nr:SRPBCC domain-containing protein [Rhodospirillaceae bacterium]MXW92633.1 SRPBCC domain-containing protein [Rhodospirillaceae bacterium]MYB14960.1 SRPBCC domain-containing protein [Rhodospirillaceae bacterium]MYI47601.1 SRPBCC domain-containing protein [Rhodospirillaceae bacterium]
MTGLEPSAGAAERNVSLTLHRVIDAPVEAVYAAWTEPEMLRRWLAPGNATVVRAVAEATVGGTFLIEMRGADGRKWLTRGRYRDVVPLRRLVHTWRWDGSDVETLVTVEFEPEEAGRTRLTLTHARFAQEEARDEHVQGWTGCLAKLGDLWPA